jgi:hypothetical protein
MFNEVGHPQQLLPDVRQLPQILQAQVLPLLQEAAVLVDDAEQLVEACQFLVQGGHSLFDQPDQL